MIIMLAQNWSLCLKKRVVVWYIYKSKRETVKEAEKEMDLFLKAKSDNNSSGGEVTTNVQWCAVGHINFNKTGEYGICKKREKIVSECFV